MNALNTSRIVGLCAGLLIATAGFSQKVEPGLTDWDSDGDKKISREEYDEHFDNYTYYNDWDTNNDKMLDQKEWKAVMKESDETEKFSDYDTNNDKMIDKKEYSEGEFSKMDENKDEYVNTVEYANWSRFGNH